MSGNAGGPGQQRETVKLVKQGFQRWRGRWTKWKCRRAASACRSVRSKRSEFLRPGSGRLDAIRADRQSERQDDGGADEAIIFVAGRS
jgi:hypothetical protein